MNQFKKAAAPASTEKDLLMQAYDSLDSDGRTKLFSYAKYLLAELQATTEQRAAAKEFNQALADAAASNQSVVFK